MKLKNLLLIGLLLVTANAWAVQEFKDPAAVGKDPDSGVDVVDGGDGKPAAGGAGAGTANAAVVSSIPAEEGLLAKLELLRGQLTGVPEECRGATLVHGAMLWEFGIVKALYTLLITPEKDAAERLVAGEPICPLGAVLKQLFYLAGGTLTTMPLQSMFAYKLTPQHLGELYKIMMEGESIIRWTAFSMTMKRGGEAKKQFNESKKALTDALTDLTKSNKSHDVLNPVNLFPSIIMAYFWAKYIIPAGDLAAARANLKAFNEAAFATPLASAASASASAQSPDLVEDEAIERIKTFYKYDIPKPPVQGTVVLSNGRSFPDCGESGLRGLFQTIFYNKDTQRFIIPDDAPVGFYDDVLAQYFRKFPTKNDQNTQVARNAWGAVISDRLHIAYSKAGYEMCCDFKNVMCMLAQLVPGVYKNFCASCGCSLVVAPIEAVEGAGEGVGTVTDDNLPAQIAGHFECSPNCAKKMLELFAKHHNLFLSEYNSADNKTTASWKLSFSEPEEAKCFLVYKTQKGHMDCDLEGALSSTFGQFVDPIFGCSDALTILPQNPDMIQPLVFAAARMAQQQDFVAGYFALMPGLNPALLQQLRTAISGWGLLRPEDVRVLKDSSGMLEQLLEAPVERGLINTYKFLCRTADKVPTENALVRLLLLAILSRSLPMIKFLCTQGADVNIGMTSFRWDSKVPNNECPLSFAAQIGDLPIVKFLCEEKGVDPLVSNKNAASALRNAVIYGHLPVVKYLCEKQGQKVNMIIKTNHGNASLLLEAAKLRHLDVVKYLCEEQETDVNILDTHGDTALMHAAYSDNNLAVIKYLYERGATGQDKALVHAAFCGDLPTVTYLCDELRIDPLVSNKNAASALYKAVQNGHLPVVQYLCEKQGRKVPMIIETKTGPVCLLAEAAAKGHLDVVKYLCKEQETNVNILDKHGWTALMRAIKNHKNSVVEYLRNRGGTVREDALCEAALCGDLSAVTYLCKELMVDPLISNQNTASALCNAVQNGHLPVVKYLCEQQHGRKINMIIETKTGPACLLKQAAANGHLDVVKYLCEEQETDVNSLDEYEMAPAIVWAASQKGNLAVIQYLCENGATALNDALIAAADSGDLSAVKYLCNRGANANFKNAEGATALDRAELYGFTEIADYLRELMATKVTE